MYVRTLSLGTSALNRHQVHFCFVCFSFVHLWLCIWMCVCVCTCVMLAYCCSQSFRASCRCCSHRVWMALIWSSLWVSSWRSSSKHTHIHTHYNLSYRPQLSSLLFESLTGLVIGSASLLAKPAQSLQQPGVLCFELFDQTLSGALVHHSSVLDSLCPKEVREV